MADYFHASIDIPKKFIDESEELRTRIQEENFSNEPDEENEIVTFSDPQAHDGEFECLEWFLRDHRVPFNRNSEGHYEIDGEHVVYRPAAEGFEEINVTLYCRGNGEETIELNEIKKILDENQTDEEIASKLRALYQENDPIGLIEYMEKYGDKILSIDSSDEPVVISGDFAMAFSQ